MTAGDWTCRSTPGVSRRANSANASGPDPRLDDGAIAAVEAAYAAFGQRCYFRLPDLLGEAPDRILEARGYEMESHTLTLASELQAADAHEAQITAAPTQDWVAAVNALNVRSLEASAAFEGALQRIATPAAFAAVRREGRIVSAGYGSAANGWLCLHAIVTAPDWRGQGLARQVVNGIKAWGHAQGCGQAALQVTADNEAGLKLYARMGFGRTLYGYHYRRAPRP